MVDFLQNQTGFVYGIQSLELIKVGVAMDLDRRLHTMRLLNPHGCELVFYRKVFAPYRFEKKMHELLADKAVGREWFRVTLTELRQAALTARLASSKAKTRWERWQRDDAGIGTPVTQAIDEVVVTAQKSAAI